MAMTPWKRTYFDGAGAGPAGPVGGSTDLASWQRGREEAIKALKLLSGKWPDYT